MFQEQSPTLLLPCMLIQEMPAQRTGFILCSFNVRLPGS